jgi:hypothetical protein
MLTDRTDRHGPRSNPSTGRSCAVHGMSVHPAGIPPSNVNRFVIRPQVQTPLLVVVSTGWALLGATYVTDGEAVSKPDWLGLAFGCFLLVSGAAGIWRAVRLGIVIDAEGLRVRNFDSRDQVLLWSEVEVIGRRQIGGRAGIPLLAPVLHVRGEDFRDSGAWQLFADRRRPQSRTTTRLPGSCTGARRRRVGS